MHASLYEDKQTNIYIQTLTASLTANRLTEAILTLSNFWGTKLTTSPKDSAPYLWYGKIETPSCQKTKNWERLPQTPKCYTIKYRLKPPSNCYRHVCSSKRKPYPPPPPLPLSTAYTFAAKNLRLHQSKWYPFIGISSPARKLHSLGPVKRPEDPNKNSSITLFTIITCEA